MCQIRYLGNGVSIGISNGTSTNVDINLSIDTSIEPKFLPLPNAHSHSFTLMST